MKRVLDPTLENIPPDLKDAPQWVVWKSVPENDKDGNPKKPRKVPVNPKTGRDAKANDTDTWGSYEQAAAFHEKWKGKIHQSGAGSGVVCGIGFEFKKDGPFTGVDLDNCIRDGRTLEPWAETIVKELSSYTELSPFLKGLHVIVRGKLPPGGRKRGNIEMYDEGRFFTITGNLFAPHLHNIEYRDAELKEVHSRVFSNNGAKPQGHKSTRRGGADTPTVDEAFVLERAPKARNGTRFKRLWDGDASDYLKEDGTPDYSSADQALCNSLAFWTGKDAELMDSLFRKSGLMRDKWDVVHRPADGATYGRMTIEKAITDCRDVYKAKRKRDRGADGLDDGKTDCPLCSEDGKLRKHKKAALALKPHLGDLLYDGLTQRWMGYEDDLWKPLTIHQAAGIVDRLITELAPDIDYNTSWRDGVMSQLSLYLCWDDSKTPKDAIPFKNGVLFLDGMIFEKHRKELCFTWQLPYNYNIFATCDPVRQWLIETTGDALQVELLRAYLNAILTGRADLHRYLELIGPGGTGKGTFIRLAEAVIGKENVHVSELKHLENNRFETSKLHGKRLLTITDAEKYSGDVSVLKAITGGDSIRFEEKHKQNGSPFRFGGMVLVAANQDMGSSDYTSGLQRRRITVRFEKVVPPEKRRDLESEFEPYLPGVINWALSMPQERVTALLRDTDKYVRTLAGSSMQTLINTNPIADWAHDCLVYSLPFVTFIGGSRFDDADEKLFSSYNKWCEDTGHKPMALNRFVILLKDLLCNQLRLDGVEHKAVRTGRCLHGIGIRRASTADEPSPLSAFFGIASTVTEKCEASAKGGEGWVKGDAKGQTRMVTNVKGFSENYSDNKTNETDDESEVAQAPPDHENAEQKKSGGNENTSKPFTLVTEPLQTFADPSPPFANHHRTLRTRVKCIDCFLVDTCPTPSNKAEHGTMTLHTCREFRARWGAA